MATLGKITIQDISAKEARAFKAVGAINGVETREVNGGYVQVAVSLSYRLSAADSQDRQFVARFNLKPEWLTPEYSAKVKAGTITGSEAIQYNINVRGLLRGLFTGAGVTEGDLDFGQLNGKLVGFRTKPRRDDPSRLDIGAFFAPRG